MNAINLATPLARARAREREMCTILDALVIHFTREGSNQRKVQGRDHIGLL